MRNQNFIFTDLFRFALYNPDYKNYKTSPKSFADKFSFFFKVEVPIVMVDNWKQRIAQWKMILGILPMAESDNQKIEKYVYERIYEICKRSGAKMVVLKIGGFGYSDEQRS